jgi:hypothetical protein
MGAVMSKSRRFICSSMSRTVGPAVAILFGLSVASAQQPEVAGVKLPACSQSMIIATTWQAVFNQYSGLFAFACPINIASNGTLTSGTCTFPAGQSIVTSPSGTLTIDRTCHVVGSVAFSTCRTSNCASNTLNSKISVSLWRSEDGTRISGMQQFSNCDSSSVCDPAPDAVGTFELVAQ